MLRKTPAVPSPRLTCVRNERAALGQSFILLDPVSASKKTKKEKTIKLLT